MMWGGTTFGSIGVDFTGLPRAGGFLKSYGCSLAKFLLS